MANSEKVIVNLKGEVWKPVVWHYEFERKLHVSNYGRIKTEDRSVSRPKNGLLPFKAQIIKTRKGVGGYMYVELTRKPVRKDALVHRIVAIAFIDNPSNKPFVNHKDGDKTNNCVANLEWCTASENTKHAFDTGLAVNAQGADSVMAKLTSAQVREIRQAYAAGGVTYRDLADLYQVGKENINRIVNYRTYRNVE